MPLRRFPRAAALLLLPALCVLLQPHSTAYGQAGLPEFPNVTTIAGTGVMGTLDGPAAAAQFMFPTGVAVDGKGTIYVADTDAQRIKAVMPDGSVRTIAGGGGLHPHLLYVDGAYADGPGLDARFSVPLGIALAPDGTLYVADAGNHAVREIKDGNVSTLAGDPREAGNVLGPVRLSRFARPVAVALDHEGDLYVADLMNGIREITPDGEVVAVELPGVTLDRPAGISVYENTRGKYLAIADAAGLILAFPDRGPARVTTRWTEATTDLVPEGLAPLGYPFGIVMTGPHSMIFTDPRTHTIRTYANLASRVLAGETFDDIENQGGGDRDGAGPQARFDTPMGIARDPDGGFVVADAGNRKLRRLSTFDARDVVNPLLDERPKLEAGAYNIVLFGASIAWFDTDFSRSIAGCLERDLRDAKPDGKPIRITTEGAPGIGLPATEQFFDVYRDVEPKPDFAIMMINSTTLGVSYGGELLDDRHNAEVAARTSENLRHIATVLKNPHAVLGLIAPYPWEFSGSEDTYARYFRKVKSDWLIPVPSYHQILADGVTNAGWPLLDLWPVFETNEATADHVPYFGTIDEHLTPAGRELVAKALADWFVAHHPWDASR